VGSVASAAARRWPRGGREEVAAPTAMAADPTRAPGEIARVEGELEAEGGGRVLNGEGVGGDDGGGEMAAEMAAEWKV